MSDYPEFKTAWELFLEENLEEKSSSIIKYQLNNST